jgi:AraC-like DNA-binding protein
MLPLLDRAPMLHSRDLDETRAFLAKKVIRMELLGSAASAASIDVRLNGVYLRDAWLGYVAYGTPAQVQFCAGSSAWLGREAGHAKSRASASRCGDFWIHIPLRGRFEARTADRVIECDQRCGVVISPHRPLALRTNADSTRLSISFRSDALERQLAALIGDTPAKPIFFDPELRLEQGLGGRLSGMLRCAAGEFERDALRANPLLVASFEQFVMNWLLLSQPSNYSDAIGKPGRPVAPRDVKRAVEYIHGYLGQPIKLPDLVAASDVPGRTLLKHFSDCYGISPMRYLRNQRLDQVRAELAAGRAQSVAAAALRWGLAHPGRFAIDYRKRFGETPSATLAKGRTGS